VWRRPLRTKHEATIAGQNLRGISRDEPTDVGTLDCCCPTFSSCVAERARPAPGQPRPLEVVHSAGERRRSRPAPEPPRKATADPVPEPGVDIPFDVAAVLSGVDLHTDGQAVEAPLGAVGDAIVGKRGTTRGALTNPPDNASPQNNGGFYVPGAENPPDIGRAGNLGGLCPRPPLTLPHQPPRGASPHQPRRETANAATPGRRTHINPLVDM
jgi:hypothetical protein